MDLMKEIEALEPQMIEDRRTLHRQPELAFCEYKTTAFLKQRLEEFGVELEPLNMETGISAIIRGSRPGPTICIRNDLDALPIQEETGLPFASEIPGVSHACGHDIHAITAIYCAKLLNERKDQLSGNVRIVVQPAEETANGACAMVKAGAMEIEPKSDIVIGTHVHPASPVGTITLMKGPAEAGTTGFAITVKGSGGHGAYPHLCVDPIVVASYLVAQLQTIVSRENMPTKAAVLTFGAISGGHAANIIPNEVKLSGTLRTLDSDALYRHKDAIVRITENTCRSMRAEGIVEFIGNDIPPVVNDGEVVDGIMEAADQVLGEGHIQISEYPSMGSDDFSIFLNNTRGAQFFVGSSNELPNSRIGLHRSENVFDEKSLSIGTAIMTRYVLNKLGAPKDA